MHGRFVEKVNLSPDRTGGVRHTHQLGIVPMDDLSEEQRTWARQLLQSVRAMQHKALPPALTPDHAEDEAPARSPVLGPSASQFGPSLRALARSLEEPL